MNTSVSRHTLFNRLRYKHLLMLVTLGNSGNLHRTAELLHISQPGITRMLREIESMFGCELFERLNRGMRPNELGHEAVRFARNALSGLDRFADDLAALQQGGFGELSIGAIMGAAPDLVMQAVSDIKMRHPRLRIRIMGDTTDQLIELLERGQIDLAVAREVALDKRDIFSFTPLGNERLCFAVRAGHPLLDSSAATATAAALSFEALSVRWSWICQPASSPARIAIAQAFNRIGVPFPRDIIECGSVFAMLQLVQLTDGIMVLSEAVIKDYVRSGLIFTLPIEIDVTLPPFGVLLRRSETLSPQLETFLSMLQARAGMPSDDRLTSSSAAPATLSIC